jgi:hypothetical protein
MTNLHPALRPGRVAVVTGAANEDTKDVFEGKACPRFRNIRSGLERKLAMLHAATQLRIFDLLRITGWRSSRAIAGQLSLATLMGPPFARVAGLGVSNRCLDATSRPLTSSPARVRHDGDEAG